MPPAPAWSRGVHRKGRGGSLRRRSGRCPAGCRGHCGLPCSLPYDLRMTDHWMWRRGRRREQGRFGDGDGLKKGRRRQNATLWRWCYPFSHPRGKLRERPSRGGGVLGFYQNQWKERCLVGCVVGPHSLMTSWAVLFRGAAVATADSRLQ